MACIVWILDAGVEHFLSVSLGSLRVNAPRFWDDHPKVVIDCGLSLAARNYLEQLRGEGIYVVRSRFGTSSTDSAGVPAMRQRVDISEVAKEFGGILPPFGGHVLVVDADTVFLKSPDLFPFPDARADLSIMPDWDIVNGKIAGTPMFRRSSLNRPQALDRPEHVARQLGLAVSELLALRSHNTGVFGFHADREFADPWRRAYAELSAVTDGDGLPAFAPFAVEQNAMALAIHRRWITCGALPRRFNRLPPRPPRRWPSSTVIAHFVTFHRFHREGQYALWFQTVAKLRQAGVLPPHFDLPFGVEQ